MHAWTKHLNQSSFDENYENYKESINIKLTQCLSDITNELMQANLGYTPEVANKMAINLLMEQLLSLQYQHTPESQKAMVVNLFVEMPEIQDIRFELVGEIKESLKNQKPKM